MDQRVPVPTQAALLALVVSAAVLACGHDCGFATVVVVGLGAAGWAILALLYRLRRDSARDDDRRKRDRWALASALIGFGMPLGFAIWAWRTPSFDGWFLHTGAAAFGAVLLAVMLTAILTSSMLDWYLVLPFVLGQFGPPIWAEDPGVRDRRRWFAQLWVLHRGACELLAFSSLALLLAIGLVALGNAVSTDRTLPAAFESLGGASIALGVFGYLGARLRPALDFALSAPVGLGMWVVGSDEFGRDVGGIVVDVSVHPGIKVVGPPQHRNQLDHRAFVPLRYAPLLSESERPGELGEAWCEATVRRNLARDPGRRERLPKRLLDGARRRSRVSAAALVSQLGLAAFLSSVLVVQLARPDLSAAGHTISEYVHGSAGAVLSAGLASWAVGLLACAVLVLLVPVQGSSPRTGIAVAGLLALAAAAIVVLDVFPTQTVAGALPAGEQWTTAGRLHDIGSGTTTVAILGAAVASLWVLRAHRRYRQAVLALLATALAGSIAGLAIGTSVGGLRQRLLVAVAIAWQALFTETLRRRGLGPTGRD